MKRLICLTLVMLFTGCACGRKAEHVDAYKRALATQTKRADDDEKAMTAMHRTLVSWHKKMKAQGVR